MAANALSALVSTGFMPHGYCFLWSAPLMWTYLAADSVIGLSYYSIPLALLYFVHRRKDIQFNWMFLLFSLFIFFCGTTHLFSVWTIWHPDYWADAGIKAITAIASVITAVCLWPLIPKAIKIPSPSQLSAVIGDLEREVRERQKAEAALAEANRTLEQQVAQRTAALEASNHLLQKEIEERTAAEAVQRASESRLHSLVTAISELVWRADSDGETISTEPSFSEYTGLTLAPQRSVSDNWMSAIHPEDLPRLRTTWAEALSRQSIWRDEYRIRHATGEWGYVASRAAPIFNEDGSVSEWMGLSVDVTERRRAQEQILTLNRRLQQLIATVQRLAAARDLDAIASAVAEAARSLAGADSSSLLLRERDSVVCVSAGSGQTSPEPARQPLAGSLPGITMLDGIPLIIDDITNDPRSAAETYRSQPLRTLVLLPLNGPESIGAVGCYWRQPHAVGNEEFKLLQTLANAAAIAMANTRQYQELEQRVAERTAQLQAANKELESFTYSVSHDLKAPLRTIDGFSRLLLDEHAANLNDEGKEFLDFIRQGTRQMNQLIQDLLEYSRTERRQITNSTIDLRKLVQAILDQSEADITKRRAAVRIAMPDGTVEGDENGLRMALRNLIDNALKFSATTPKPEIEIGGRREARRLVLWVKDNGIGIDPKFHERIFEIFQRLHRAEEYPGTGIGLAIVRKAMQRMGGNARVESAPNQGATFFLEIPL